MGYTPLLLIVCVCVVYVTEGRSADAADLHRLVSRGVRRPRAPNMIGGYLYGKRSSVMEDDVMRTMSRQYLSIQEVASILQKDDMFALAMAKKLDTNGDGYVQMSDLL